MASSFRVYVDESGCEGFRFLPNAAGSSEWFVESALIVRTERDHEIVNGMRSIRALLKRAKDAPLHFVDLKHDQRVAWAKAIAQCPVRTVSILVHKPSIDDPEVFKAKKFHLYRYTSRLLMERVSWFCRDHHEPNKGDGTAEIIFSNRRKMSYEAIREYWSKLKNDPSHQGKVRIDWKHVDPQAISSINHDQLAGLQMADCIASSHWKAVSLNTYGNNEARYLLELRKKIYRHQKESDGYGLKFWPPFQKLRPSNAHLSVFDGL